MPVAVSSCGIMPLPAEHLHLQPNSAGAAAAVAAAAGQASYATDVGAQAGKVAAAAPLSSQAKLALKKEAVALLAHSLLSMGGPPLSMSTTGVAPLTASQQQAAVTGKKQPTVKPAVAAACRGSETNSSAGCTPAFKSRGAVAALERCCSPSSRATTLAPVACEVTSLPAAEQQPRGASGSLAAAATAAAAFASTESAPSLPQQRGVPASIAKAPAAATTPPQQPQHGQQSGAKSAECGAVPAPTSPLEPAGASVTGASSLACPAAPSLSTSQQGCSALAAQLAPCSGPCLMDTANADIQTLSSAVAACKLGLTEQLTSALGTCNSVAHARDAEGRTCLHYAAGYGQEDCVDVLLARGADPCVRDANGDVPLHFASIHGHPMCAYNISKAAPSSCLVRNVRGQTPIDVAVACERGEVLNAMLLACAGDGSDAAVTAMARLLRDGAVPDTWAPNGSSALMLAAAADGTNALRVLLEHGATIELQDALGRSALMFAAGNCALHTLETLLDAGACIAQRDRRLRSVLDYAPDGSQVREVLLKRLAALEAVAAQRQADLLAALEGDAPLAAGPSKAGAATGSSKAKKKAAKKAAKKSAAKAAQAGPDGSAAPACDAAAEAATEQQQANADMEDGESAAAAEGAAAVSPCPASGPKQAWAAVCSVSAEAGKVQTGSGWPTAALESEIHCKAEPVESQMASAPKQQVVHEQQAACKLDVAAQGASSNSPACAEQVAAPAHQQASSSNAAEQPQQLRQLVNAWKQQQQQQQPDQGAWQVVGVKPNRKASAPEAAAFAVSTPTCCSATCALPAASSSSSQHSTPGMPIAAAPSSRVSRLNPVGTPSSAAMPASRRSLDISIGGHSHACSGASTLASTAALASAGAAACHSGAACALPPVALKPKRCGSGHSLSSLGSSESAPAGSVAGSNHYAHVSAMVLSHTAGGAGGGCHASTAPVGNVWHRRLSMTEHITGVSVNGTAAAAAAHASAASSPQPPATSVPAGEAGSRLSNAAASSQQSSKPNKPAAQANKTTFVLSNLPASSTWASKSATSSQPVAAAASLGATIGKPAAPAVVAPAVTAAEAAGVSTAAAPASKQVAAEPSAAEPCTCVTEPQEQAEQQPEAALPANTAAELSQLRHEAEAVRAALAVTAAASAAASADAAVAPPSGSESQGPQQQQSAGSNSTTNADENVATELLASPVTVTKATRTAQVPAATTAAAAAAAAGSDAERRIADSDAQHRAMMQAVMQAAVVHAQEETERAVAAERLRFVSHMLAVGLSQDVVLAVLQSMAGAAPAPSPSQHLSTTHASAAAARRTNMGTTNGSSSGTDGVAAAAPVLPDLSAACSAGYEAARPSTAGDTAAPDPSLSAGTRIKGRRSQGAASAGGASVDTATSAVLGSTAARSALVVETEVLAIKAPKPAVVASAASAVSDNAAPCKEATALTASQAAAAAAAAAASYASGADAPIAKTAAAAAAAAAAAQQGLGCSGSGGGAAPRTSGSSTPHDDDALLDVALSLAATCSLRSPSAATTAAAAAAPGNVFFPGAPSNASLLASLAQPMLGQSCGLGSVALPSWVSEATLGQGNGAPLGSSVPADLTPTPAALFASFFSHQPDGNNGFDCDSELPTCGDISAMLDMSDDEGDMLTLGILHGSSGGPASGGGAGSGAAPSATQESGVHPTDGGSADGNGCGASAAAAASTTSKASGSRAGLAGSAVVSGSLTHWLQPATTQSPGSRAPSASQPVGIPAAAGGVSGTSAAGGALGTSGSAFGQAFSRGSSVGLPGSPLLITPLPGSSWSVNAGSTAGTSLGALASSTPGAAPMALTTMQAMQALGLSFAGVSGTASMAAAAGNTIAAAHRPPLSPTLWRTPDASASSRPGAQQQQQQQQQRRHGQGQVQGRGKAFHHHPQSSDASWGSDDFELPEFL